MPSEDTPSHSEDTARALEPAALQAVLQSLSRAFAPSCIGTEDLQVLARLARQHHFAAQATVLYPQSRGDAIWLVSRGRVSLGIWDALGEWRQTRSAGPGDWLDVASAWTGGVYVEAAIAAMGASVYEFPIEPVQLLASTQPALGLAFVQLLSRKVRSATRQAADLALKDLPARLAGWLLDAQAASVDPGQPIVLGQYKRALASELGATPETLSRALSRFRQLGYIEGRGYKVTLRDVAGLRRESGRESGTALPPR